MARIIDEMQSESDWLDSLPCDGGNCSLQLACLLAMKEEFDDDMLHDCSRTI